MVSIILKLGAKQLGLPILDDVSTALVLGVVSMLSLYILLKFIAGCKAELAEKAAKA